MKFWLFKYSQVLGQATQSCWFHMSNCMINSGNSGTIQISVHVWVPEPLLAQLLLSLYKLGKGFPGDSVVKNPPANAGAEGDTGLIPRSRRSLREGNGNPLQYPCLGKPMDRGAWQGSIHGGHQRIRHNLATEHAKSEDLIKEITKHIDHENEGHIFKASGMKRFSWHITK